MNCDIELHEGLIEFSLPRSRFLDVTQRSPKRTAADIRTTFLSHCPCGLFAVH